MKLFFPEDGEDFDVKHTCGMQSKKAVLPSPVKHQSDQEHLVSFHWRAVEKSRADLYCCLGETDWAAEARF